MQSRLAIYHRGPTVGKARNVLHSRAMISYKVGEPLLLRDSFYQKLIRIKSHQLQERFLNSISFGGVLTHSNNYFSRIKCYNHYKNTTKQDCRTFSSYSNMKYPSNIRASHSTALQDTLESDTEYEADETYVKHHESLMESDSFQYSKLTSTSQLVKDMQHDYDSPSQSLFYDSQDSFDESSARNKNRYKFSHLLEQDPVIDDENKISSYEKKYSEPIDKFNMASLLHLFEPNRPPNLNINLNSNNINEIDKQKIEDELFAYQLWVECESQRETVSKYEATLQSARERQDFTSLYPVRQYLLKWYQSLRNKIEEEQRQYLLNSRGKKDRVNYGLYLCSLQPEKLAVILAHIGITYALSQGGDGATVTNMAICLGDAVEAEVNIQRVLMKKVREQYKNARKNEIKENKVDDDMQTSLNEAKATDTVVSNSDNTKNNNDFEVKTEIPVWMYGASHLQRFVDDANQANPSSKTRMRIKNANKRALKLLQGNGEHKPWSDMIKAKIGAALIQILVKQAILDNGDQAFTYEKKRLGWNRTVGTIKLDQKFYEMIVEEKYESLAPYCTRHKPMVAPPRKWVAPNDGGYYAIQSNIMRTHGCQVQKKALSQADLNTIFDGLNALGHVPWKINKHILSVAQECWDQGIVLGDIPSRQDLVVPPEPIPPEKIPKSLYDDKDSEEYKTYSRLSIKYREEHFKYKRMSQKNMDLRSLRCSALLKLNQAEKFKDFPKIYFPYNLDFRGRAYPVPPHLSNVGSDLCRGILTFAESKPLGEHGLYWLKVHIANLAGKDKISFDERAQFTEENIDLIRDSVENPLGGERWWMSCDDPFQALAACIEVVNAIDSGDPQNYECSLPVHMDGSCNGLQHYAALGLDSIGGKAVNLCPSDMPQDVYSGVMKEVIARVQTEAKRNLDIDDDSLDLSKSQKVALRNNKAAKLVDGLIDRGVVKRTVMTSVYGVTFMGAKQQIFEKIEEKLVEKGIDVDEIEADIHAASIYLASVTMDVMGDLFQGARQTMKWLATCARLISSQGTPMAWLTPLGLPVVQPYRQSKPYTIVTLLQHMVLSNNTDNLPIHKSRQVTAFPPNYVHSLDSSHMILTALEMEKKGLTFSAVHDSFWTHASDIDELNSTLRECFVDLYEKPLLEELKEMWEIRYPSISFPDLPKKGDLDLNKVKEAPYFFQ